MIYASQLDGDKSAVFRLDADEHERFKQGRAIVKSTADAHGEYQIVIKRIKIRRPFILRNTTLGMESADYARNRKAAIDMIIPGAKFTGAKREGKRMVYRYTLHKNDYELTFRD